jgi:protein tyrosine/serine phosphatase
LNKRTIIIPAIALGAAGLVVNYINQNNLKNHTVNNDLPSRKKSIFRIQRSSSKISRSLLKVLNSIENNRLLFIEVNTKNKKMRDVILNQLEKLKTDEPVDDMWIADFYKQSFSRDDIVTLANKKAIFYLSSLEEVEKVKISARTTAAKLVGNSLSKLSTKYPLIEKYLFEPMLDMVSPLKETDELSNFGIVAEDKLYRGGMPVGQHNYDKLSELGIKTVVNLKIEDSAVEYVAEQNSLSKRDINLHYIPLPNVAAPTLQQTLEFLTVVYNKDMSPVFIHCHRGADRTGIMAGIFRITQGYSASWALVEAEKFNIASSFHDPKIEFVYKFEQYWTKWKSQGKIPENLNNFDFLSLVEDDIQPDDNSKAEHTENDTIVQPEEIIEKLEDPNT